MVQYFAGIVRDLAVSRVQSTYAHLAAFWPLQIDAGMFRLPALILRTQAPLPRLEVCGRVAGFTSFCGIVRDACARLQPGVSA